MFGYGYEASGCYLGWCDDDDNDSITVTDVNPSDDDDDTGKEGVAMKNKYVNCLCRGWSQRVSVGGKLKLWRLAGIARNRTGVHVSD